MLQKCRGRRSPCKFVNSCLGSLFIHTNTHIHIHIAVSHIEDVRCYYLKMCMQELYHKSVPYILPPPLPHFIEMHCVAHIYRSTGRAQGPAHSNRRKLLAFPASTDCKSPVKPRRKPRTKHVHRPGAHAHREADTADSALHLLGDADLGHLYFKFVPHVPGSKSLCALVAVILADIMRKYLLVI